MSHHFAHHNRFSIHHNRSDLPPWILVTIFVIIPITYSILWVIYYYMTKFTKVVKVADKFMKSQQVGNLQVSSNHRRLTTNISDTRQTLEEYFLLDTDRNLYNVSDCLFCGFYIGSFGKYARVVPGDTIEINGYGGYFTGIADIYSIRRLESQQ